MERLDLVFFVVGLLLCILIVVVSVRVLLYWKKRKEKKKNDEAMIQQKVNILSEFQVPVSYQRIQGTNPWRHHNIPMVSVTQHEDTSNENDSPSTVKRKTKISERRKSISAHMLSELYKQRNHISSNDSSDTDERRSTLSDEGSVSSFDGSDDGRHRYVDSNVFGVKKRIAKTRRLGPGSHHSRHRPSFKKTGKISFETEYNEEKQELQVHLLRAVELAPKLEVEHINPFVRVYLVPGKLQKQSTHFKKSTKEPVFNETVHFIDINKDQLQRHKLRMKVYNHSKLRKHELIGEVDIALVSLDLRFKETFNVDLFVKKSEILQASCLVSICHHAAQSKLQVTVQEAKNLQKTKLTGTNPDSYAVARLYKGDTSEKQEGEVIRNTRSPQYGSSFTFQLATDFEFPLSVFSLVITIVNHNLIGRDEVIGHMIFSLDSPQPSAVTYWNEVNKNPEEIQTRWHTLISPEDV